MNRDPGLQVERTRLAWRRTWLSMAVVAVLTARLALSRDSAAALLATAALSGWVAVMMLAFPRVDASGPRRPDAGSLALPLSALTAVGYIGLGILLILG